MAGTSKTIVNKVCRMATFTAQKVSIFADFLGWTFPNLDWIRVTQSEYGKIPTRKTPIKDTFHAVTIKEVQINFDFEHSQNKD